MDTKVYNAVIGGTSDYNIRFADFINLLEALGFYKVRQRGSHMIFKHPKGCSMNVQKDGSKAKGYQVAQLRNLINQYRLK